MGVRVQPKSRRKGKERKNNPLRRKYKKILWRYFHNELDEGYLFEISIKPFPFRKTI
jgi:hypothetical protein